jgi:hypothetical protein
MALPKVNSTMSRGMDQRKRKINQGMRKVPPSLVAAIRGKRQIFPVPTAMLSMASIMPQREENVSDVLMQSGDGFPRELFGHVRTGSQRNVVTIGGK